MRKLAWDEALKSLPFIAAAFGAFVFRETPVPAIHGALIVIVLIVAIVDFAIGTQAVRLWRRLRLPETSTSSDGPAKPQLVLVVHEESSAAIAGEIKARSGAHASTAITSPQGQLPAEMNNADAIYFVWTRAMSDTPAVLRALDEWGWNHLHVPVLIVDAAGLEVDRLGNFTVVPIEQATPGRMLRQLILRTHMWIAWSMRLHRRWVYATALFFVALLSLGYGAIRYRYVKASLDARDVPLEPALTVLATDLAKTRQLQEQPVETPPKMNASLTKAAAFLLSDVQHLTDASSTPNDSFAIFRRVGPNLKEIDETSSPLSLAVQDSIAGCSLRNTAFVLWEKECSPGQPGAWDKFGRPIGRYLQGCTIQLDAGHNNDVCRYQTSTNEAALANRGVLCYSPDIVGSVPSDTVVCLTTPKSTVFLRTATARWKLQTFSVIANAIPSTALQFPP